MQQLSAMRSSLSSCGNLLAPQCPAHHRAQMGAAGAHGRVEEGAMHLCAPSRRADAFASRHERVRSIDVRRRSTSAATVEQQQQRCCVSINIVTAAADHHSAGRLAPARARRRGHAQRGAAHGAALCPRHHHAQPGPASHHGGGGESGVHVVAPSSRELSVDRWADGRGTKASTGKCTRSHPCVREGGGVPAAHPVGRAGGQRLPAAHDVLPDGPHHAGRRGGGQGGGRGGVQALPRRCGGEGGRRWWCPGAAGLGAWAWAAR